MNLQTKVLWMMAGAIALASPAMSATVVLDFEGINATYPTSTQASINNFYNGGTSSVGTSGVNYGVSFSSNALALCLNTLTVICPGSNVSRGGLAPTSDKGALLFLSGTQTFLNYAGGFNTGFSFYYSEPNTNGGVVSVYDGLNGTGSVLGTINLALTPNRACTGYTGDYCPFVPVGVTFAGTAKSIAFGGVANFIVFDDVTFGSATPGIPSAVPEPGTYALMALGLLGVGGAARRASRRTA